MGTLHEIVGWTAIGWNAAVGLWGVGFHVAKREVGPWFALAAFGGLALAGVQVGLGLVMFIGGTDPGSFHVFYGFVVLFMVAFAYIFRSTLAASPGLRWGLLALFVAGLGIRAWMTFGLAL